MILLGKKVLLTEKNIEQNSQKGVTLNIKRCYFSEINVLVCIIHFF